MAKVIFTASYEHDFRPAKAVVQTYRASPKPQSVPRAVAEAAIAAGCAEDPDAA